MQDRLTIVPFNKNYPVKCVNTLERHFTILFNKVILNYKCIINSSQSFFITENNNVNIISIVYVMLNVKYALMTSGDIFGTNVTYVYIFQCQLNLNIKL